MFVIVVGEWSVISVFNDTGKSPFLMDVATCFYWWERVISSVLSSSILHLRPSIQQMVARSVLCRLMDENKVKNVFIGSNTSDTKPRLTISQSITPKLQTSLCFWYLPLDATTSGADHLRLLISEEDGEEVTFNVVVFSITRVRSNLGRVFGRVVLVLLSSFRRSKETS